MPDLYSPVFGFKITFIVIGMSRFFFLLCETGKKREEKKPGKKQKRNIEMNKLTHSYLLQVAMTLISQLLLD